MAGTLDHSLSDIQIFHRTVPSLAQKMVAHVVSQLLCYLLLSEQGIARALCSGGEESAHPKSLPDSDDAHVSSQNGSVVCESARIETRGTRSRSGPGVGITLQSASQI